MMPRSIDCSLRLRFRPPSQRPHGRVAHTTPPRTTIVAIHMRAGIVLHALQVARGAPPVAVQQVECIIEREFVRGEPEAGDVPQALLGVVDVDDMLREGGISSEKIVL